MEERPLIKPEVRGAIPRFSEVKLVCRTETKASSTTVNHGDVAQMVERLLSMREVTISR